ncbi:beta-lactamase/transpeptidase-like protein [Chaetomium strumarium]|uniref:Beta-lactamase/transpeptidase-like protein n=1 Tax=Chaetomium strumarium TaxID=1170767 RepID=A0AAJ0GRW7_9PEZI|nr:beta-lactamase/transpeptidase-like protein [Chaetomium strumarium]
MLPNACLSLSFAALAAFSPFVAAAPRQCPPLGPVLPAPRQPSQHVAVRSAVEAIVTSLKAEIGGFNYSAISIGVQSIHEDAPLIDLHHTPPHLHPERGARQVNSSTVYRIASISKVFTVLAALQQAERGVLSMHDPVTRWLPELSGSGRNSSRDSEHELDEVDWDSITVEAVAAHLAGIGADIATDLAAFPGDWQALGLPEIPSGVKRPDCSGAQGIRPCTREDLLEAYQHRRPPVYPPNQSPVYSNGGTSLVGLVVEAASNRTLSAVLQDMIQGPQGLGLRHTTVGNVPDNAENMFIPVGGTDWDRNLGVFDPSGGINSNTADLLAFMVGILKNRALPPSSTRRWLKPATFTSGWSGAVGAPWEIYRLDNLTTGTSDGSGSSGRITDLYTKGGTLADYHSAAVMVPDYGLVLSVLASGPEIMGLLPQLVALRVAEALIPALDQAGKEEARQRFAGTYVDPESGSRLTLAVGDDDEDKDGASGLVLSDWVVRGFDVLPHLDRYHPTRVNSTAPRSELRSVRLYPTGLETERRSAWRATFPSFTDEDAELVDGSTRLRDATCVSWQMADRLTYNYLAMDHFEFRFGEGGHEAVSVKSKAFDVEMARVSNNGTQGR